MMIDNIKKCIHNKILEYRRIMNILDNPVVQNLYDRSNQKSRESFQFHILNGNINAIREWILNKKEVGDLGYKTLRSIAKDLNIPNYSRLTKEELIISIKEIKDEKN